MARDILIVDDEADIRELIGGLLEDDGYETREAADADGALAEIRARKPSPDTLDLGQLRHPGLWRSPRSLPP